MSKSVLVVVAHADDEVLGCGGTIARHVAEGDEVHVVYMADGVGARGGDDVQAEIVRRNHARDEALRILGVTGSDLLGFPDNRMDAVPLLDIIQSLELIVNQKQPTTIYTHHYGDLNVDHRITHQAVMTACRPIPKSSVREIFTFEVMSSTEWNSGAQPSFSPNFFVDITNYIRSKQSALIAYNLEMRPSPHSRCADHIATLARHRGLCVGVEAAEAYMVMRLLK